MKYAYHKELDIYIRDGGEDLPGVVALTSTRYAILYDGKARVTLYITGGYYKPVRWIPPAAERWDVQGGGILPNWCTGAANKLNAAQAAWAAEHGFVEE